MIQQDFNSLLQFIRESDPKYFNQMTLGKLIQELEKLPKDKLIEKIGKPHSYRGYYSDLAFERQEGTIAIGELLNELKNNCHHNFRCFGCRKLHFDQKPKTSFSGINFVNKVKIQIDCK